MLEKGISWNLCPRKIVVRHWIRRAFFFKNPEDYAHQQI